MTDRNAESKEEQPGTEPADAAAKRKAAMKELLSYLEIIGVTLVLFLFVLNSNKVPSESMEPTIRTESLLIGFRLPYLLGDPVPKHGDIIVFRDPDSPRFLVKRTIGLPGDTVSFDGQGNVFLNGEKMEEPYLAEQNVTVSPVDTFTVPEGTVFVMGDNRLHSLDSRYKATPFIPIHSIYSKGLFSFPAPFLF